MAAIGWAHTSVGIDPPPIHHQAVRAVVKGLARRHGQPAVKRKALTGADIARLLEHVPAGTLAGTRDRALLAIGYFGALRRSEIVALDRRDLEEVGEGLDVLVARSKTDPEAVGVTKGLKRRRGITDPVPLFRTWVAASGIPEGPLFPPIARHGNRAAGRPTGPP